MVKHLFVACLVASVPVLAQVGIGTSSPDASAALEISSANKGLLIPRIALVSATDVTTVPNPATGLLIYQTATLTDLPTGFCMWTGSSWEALVTEGSAVRELDDLSDARVGGLGFGNSILLGHKSLPNAVSAAFSVGIGQNVLQSSTTGGYNVAIGANALRSSTSGNTNIAIGTNSMVTSTIAEDNVAIGNGALRYNLTGSSNISIGRNSLESADTAQRNTAIGAEALSNASLGGSNIAIGFQAGYNHAGSRSTFIGVNSGSDSANVVNAIAIGHGARVRRSNAIEFGNDQTQNIFLNAPVRIGSNGVGEKSASLELSDTTKGLLLSKIRLIDAIDMVSIADPVGGLMIYNLASRGGWDSIWPGIYVFNSANRWDRMLTDTDLWLDGNHSNIRLGWGALSRHNTSIPDNTAIGYSALAYLNAGYDNTATGAWSQFYNLNGSNNVSLGKYSLFYNESGDDNVAIGNDALVDLESGNKNIAVGGTTLSGLINGNRNTAVGFEAGNVGSLNALLNTTSLGYQSLPTASNQVVLGNNAITALRCQVTSITALSDARDKIEIEPIRDGVATLQRLKPVAFTWNARDSTKVGIPAAGFIAQDLLEVQSKHPQGKNLDLVDDSNPDRYEARYGNLLPILVAALKEQQAMIDELQSEVDSLKQSIRQP